MSDWVGSDLNFKGATMILEGLAPCKGIRNQESGKYLLVESGILGFKIQNIQVKGSESY